VTELGPERPVKVAPDGTVWNLTESGFIVVDPDVATAGS
jgi:hypothetical protein